MKKEYTMNNKDSARKRIMFIQKEDYNYLIYNLILVLDGLGCLDESKPFKDFRRIAYILEFLGSSKSIDEYTQEELGNIYLKAQVKKKLLSHVLIILKNKGYIDISANVLHRTFDIWLNKNNIPNEFWDERLFELEIDNLEKVKKYIPRFRIGVIKTLAERVFLEKNVLIWEV